MAVNLFEELVRGHFQSQGYFTLENASFAMAGAPSRRSDIDILCLHPNPPPGAARVVVVNCKSCHGGLRITHLLNRADQADHPYKEMLQPAWIDGLRVKVLELTGESEFDYCCAVTRFSGDGERWCGTERARRLTGGGKVTILTFSDVVHSGRSTASAALHPNAPINSLVRLLRSGRSVGVGPVDAQDPPPGVAA